MNYVEVIGGTKKQRILSEDVAFWCIEKMMPRMKTLEIEIQLSKLEIEAYELQDTLLKEYKGEI